MSQKETKKEYLAPDYDDHPREEDVLEDCIEEVSEEEIRTRETFGGSGETHREVSR